MGVHANVFPYTIVDNYDGKEGLTIDVQSYRAD
jgi:hypothetical protein